jgi:aminoglycoside phosphotransferase family enzyme/predicted kinase
MSELSPEDHERLVTGLLEFLRLSGTGTTPERIETHISNVLLHGDFAYKIKKPLDLGFLDFTTLQRRRFFCEEEIRLNRRLAPQIYLDVVPITGSITAPVLGGAGEAVEFAVRMRRFSQDAVMSRLAESAALPLETMNAVAGQLAAFHEAVARAPADSEFCTPEAAHFPVQENFEQLFPLIVDTEAVAQLRRLQAWSLNEFNRQRALLGERGAQGWIRECHGDMHLGNMALIEDDVVIFDGIEFNERMRWTDVLGDVAFLAMDLDDRDLPVHSHRFLNAYFEQIGDYSALPLLNYYRAYRAMVRAKIAALRLAQSPAAVERERVLAAYQSYTDLAERYTRVRKPLLCITHGLSGTGKTTIAGLAVDRYGMLRIRSDVERKRLHGLTASQDSGSAVGKGIYGAEATRATYARLAAIAETALQAGQSVIVDAAFLKDWQRRAFSELAARVGAKFVILDIEAPLPVLRQRLIRRRERGGDASEAGQEVLEQQLVHREPLAGEELASRRVVQAQQPDIEAALRVFVEDNIGVGSSDG